MIFNHPAMPSEVDPPHCDLLDCGKVKDCNACLPPLENTIRKRMSELTPEEILEDPILKAHRDLFMLRLARAIQSLHCSRYAKQIPSMNVML